MSRPPCYNRPTAISSLTVRDGYTEDGRVKYQQVAHFSADRCTQWDGQGIGPNGESFAEHHYGDACNGCRWIPEGR